MTLSDLWLCLCVLQELTDWASCEEEDDADGEEVVLEAEEHKRGSRVPRVSRLALLQVLAVVVERLHHTLLLRKRTQVSAARRGANCGPGATRGQRS